MNTMLRLLKLAPIGLVFILLAACAAQAAILNPGQYGNRDGSVVLDLSSQPDGSMLAVMKSGRADGPPEQEENGPPKYGLALIVRLAPSDDGDRLAGNWLALPESLVAGRGRIELAILGPDAFAIKSFSPSLNAAPWPEGDNSIFNLAAPAPRPDAFAQLRGGWSLAYWYVAGQEALDLGRGVIRLAPEGAGLSGTWEAMPGQCTLSPSSEGARLAYVDEANSYKMEAYLKSLHGGLMLSGQFSDTLGRGEIRLVRQGLPAMPPLPLQKPSGGAFGGIWVDTRTGDDYFEISGNRETFEFSAYGGDRKSPRYLSEGSAKAISPGLLEGRATDQAGYCCGNQGRMSFSILDENRMEVRSTWWPQGEEDPGAEPGDPYIITRRSAPGAAGAVESHTWPLMAQPSQGMPALDAGRIRASLEVKAGGKQGGAIFSNLGYGHGLELSLDDEGRPGAVLYTETGPIALRSKAPLQPGKRVLELIYSAGGAALLQADGVVLAEAVMPAPLLPGNAPHLVGGSRWPGRTYGGAITKVELFAGSGQEAEGQGGAVLAYAPDPEARDESRQSARKDIWRFYNPAKLLHAYTADQDFAENLAESGFQREGVIGQIYEEPLPGATALYAYKNLADGSMLLGESDTPPEGFETNELLGFAPAADDGQTESLLAMEADFPPGPLAIGGKDRLYTSRKDQAIAAQGYGYGRPKLAGRVFAAAEPALRPILAYTWAGAWRGDGWGHFHIIRQENTLHVFWYYGQISGPHYYGRYELGPDGRTARGVAVGSPGDRASYYQHSLELTAAAAGPMITLQTRRLAAPYDDGRLVSFRDGAVSEAGIMKAAPGLDMEAEALLKAFMAGESPARQLEQALAEAAGQGRLVEN